MIPKIIHNCWFGRGPMPQLALDCIESWHKHMPDWEYKLWNEDNFDVNSDQDVQSDSLYINAYDNTILYQDKILNEILSCLDKPDVVSSFMFVSDHGEHITATGGGHGGDCAPKVEEYHVPLIFWHSDLYGERYPEKVENALSHKAQPVNSDNVFYSVCDMAGITLPLTYSDLTYSIFSPDFEVHPRFVLVPDGKNYIAVD